MHPAEVEQELSSLTLLYDTREQPGKRLDERLAKTGLPSVRKKLGFGDYSCMTENYDFSEDFCIERKMNLDELAMCMGTQRGRFEREFQRAKAAGARVYLLVENCNLNDFLSDFAYKAKTRSRMNRKAMINGLFAFCARYNITPVFVNEGHSGEVIKEILYREAKEILTNE